MGQMGGARWPAVKVEAVASCEGGRCGADGRGTVASCEGGSGGQL